ncbi:gustatory receptor 23a-like [Neodiprion virginianus]|uniref:gustatory receptor 23a-like n=1 Tax=Neodiprion virginianus TaxID=2961670 RepID=UPI001EE7601A|nr:gustatory receptor 23a-like [Neodiprion virginianus]
MTAKRPEKFLQLTKIILHGFKVFGLAPFSVQAKNLFANFGKPVCIWAFSFSKIGLVYNLLLAILIPIANVLLVPKYLVADYEEKFQLRLSCDIAWSIVAISTVWVVIVSWTFKQNNAVIIMNRLIDTDFRLSLKKGPNITEAEFYRVNNMLLKCKDFHYLSSAIPFLSSESEISDLSTHNQLSALRSLLSIHLPFLVARVAKEIFLTFVIAYPVILLVYNVPKTVNEAKRTGLVIHKLMDATAIPVIKAELTEFSLRILHEELNFTAYGFFRLDFTLLHSMLAALVTYLVILVQYSG